MKKILIFAAAAIAILTTSCTNEQKAKTYVKRYLGDKCYKVEFFAYNENGSVASFETKYNLLKEADSVYQEGKRSLADAFRFLDLYKISHNREYLAYADQNSKESDILMVKFDKLLEDIAQTGEESVTCHTATIGYIDNNGNYINETFVLNDNLTVNCNADDYGMSWSNYLAEAKKAFK